MLGIGEGKNVFNTFGRGWLGDDMRYLALAVLLLVFCGAKGADAFADTRLKKGKMVGKGMKFKGIYEPSGVVQLADGRLLIIEDEQSHPFSLCQIGDSDGQPSLATPVAASFTGVADDLEGLAVGDEGWIYAITSHSPAENGVSSQGREKLLRFHVGPDGGIKDFQEYGELLAFLLPVLKTLDPAVTVINIEGLSTDRDGKKLLIGLRQPVVSGASLVLVLENPDGIFSRSEPPRLAPTVVQLDLLGGGIRAMAYVEHLKGYLIANESAQGAEGKLRACLWLWDGIAGHPAQPLEFPGSGKVKNIEGISPVTVGNKTLLLLVCDDGERQKDDAAHYRFIEYGELGKRESGD